MAPLHIYKEAIAYFASLHISASVKSNYSQEQNSDFILSRRINTSRFLVFY